MNKRSTILIGTIGYFILVIGGILGSESSYQPSFENTDPGSITQTEQSNSPGSGLEVVSASQESLESSYPSSHSEPSESALVSAELPTTQDSEVIDTKHFEPSDEPVDSSSVEIGEITTEPSSQPRTFEFMDPNIVITPREKSMKVELLVTKSAEVSIENLFPPVELATPIKVSEISKYPTVELKEEKVLESQVAKTIQYYKVKSPLVHDSITGLGTSDPRVEIGGSPGFELFVDYTQPRMERILKFLEVNYSDLLSLEERIEVATTLFSVVTYGECLKKLREFHSKFDESEVCTHLSREDILSVQPEDLPKNVLKEKDELYQLRGIVISIPIPFYTNASNLKWRHVVSPTGIYHSYNSGAIDGFAHFDFLSKKLHDMITYLYSPGFQFWDDTRVELYHAIKGLRAQLGHGEQSKKVKKLLSKLMEFYFDWFKGSKSKKRCSREYFGVLTSLSPVYEAVHEINSILKSIRASVGGGSVLEAEFPGISSKVIMSKNLNVRKIVVNNISPLFVKVYSGLKEGNASAETPVPSESTLTASRGSSMGSSRLSRSQFLQNFPFPSPLVRYTSRVRSSVSRIYSARILPGPNSGSITKSIHLTDLAPKRWPNNRQLSELFLKRNYL
ncbi:transmembrane protein [Cryptosporidium felis]|nr:transmembrane protein [Cryptosporidium felis]